MINEEAAPGEQRFQPRLEEIDAWGTRLGEKKWMELQRAAEEERGCWMGERPETPTDLRSITDDVPQKMFH